MPDIIMFINQASLPLAVFCRVIGVKKTDGYVYIPMCFYIPEDVLVHSCKRWGYSSALQLSAPSRSGMGPNFRLAHYLCARICATSCAVNLARGLMVVAAMLVFKGLGDWEVVRLSGRTTF
ncbi:MAG: hypothetical protein IV085_06605 [Thiobacillus sp.]|nr:hypothetical protein [Thiobacillus sp.]